MKSKLLPMLLLGVNLLFLQTAFANNIQVSDITLTGQDTANDFTLVQFNITWQNSWRDPSNYDAAWVFVKFSTDGGATWNHAKLAISGHIAPDGSAIDTPADGKGVFIYRNAVGSGANTWNDIHLKWDYGANGVSDNATVQVKVITIEMVYIPLAAFAVGSDGTEIKKFTLTTINTADARTAPSGVGSLGGEAGGFPTGETAPSDASWPNGFSAFYMMKYEISQEQYKDFLNCLTYNQQKTRTAISPDAAAGIGALSSGNADRSGLDIQTPGVASTIPALYANNLDGDTNFNEANDGQNIACNWLSWMDGAAYADWSGLRPMTELEFEKGCKGDQSPVPNEFAWGNTTITAATGISNDGAANEVPNNAGANCVFGNSGTDGPMRVGSFATSSSTREQAGASFYGIMELSGNLWERPVTIGNSDGRDFTGTLGDGLLSTNGNATNTDWPGSNVGEVTDAAGSGFRGGGWLNDSHIMQVSYRNSAAITGPSRSDIYGFRCVRPEP